MHKDDAIRIMARLTAAFPQIALEEGQAEVLVNELALLHDARMLDIAVTQIIQRDERFPSIARIRSTYRTNNELAALSRAALERQSERPVKDEIPEWVHVWNWHRLRTMEERKKENTQGSGPDRPPVRMRMFPQEKAARDEDLSREWREMSGSTAFGSIVSYVPPGLKEPDAYTWEDYEQLLREWVEDGAPEFGAAEILESVAG